MNNKHIVKLVAVAKTSGLPILIFQSTQKILGGNYAGQRLMFAQKSTKNVAPEVLLKTLGKTYIADLVADNTGFERLTNFERPKGLNIDAEPQALPSWILKYAIGKIEHIDGFWFDASAIRHTFAVGSK